MIINQAPTVSVITVCYNSARTLEKTLQSVVDQDWPNVEHIVIDGASTDETNEILARFKPFLAHVTSEPDKGIYDAMNKGLAHVSGDIVCFLNSDDQYSSPDVLSRVARQMVDGRLDALMGDVLFFNSRKPGKILRRYCSGRFNPGRFGWGWMPAHPALFLGRSVVERVGNFKADYRIAGDFEFIVRVFNDSSLRYRYFPEILVNMEAGGVSTGGLRAKILLNREVLRACRENGIRTNMLKILSKYPAKLLELVFR